MESFLPIERIENRIYIIREQKVMLDRDLAVLYDVETKALNQAVRRNIHRFPDDFMFQLTSKELQHWKSQIVTSNRERMGIRKMPLAFTEQGVAMLSSVLKSERAILVNIQIIRTFTKLRELIVQHSDLERRLDALELRYDKHFKIIFDAMRQRIAEEDDPKPEIGFHEP